MKIKLVGASGGEVTGSSYVVRAKRATVLVDAGMFQGGRQSDAKNKLPSGVRMDELDAVLLTHAHLDHTGRLPLLFRHGYEGPVYGTAATIDLAEIIMKDCARIQTQVAERRTKKGAKKGLPAVEPLYELLKWFATLAPGKPKVLLTHGEERGRGALAKLIQQKFKLTAGLPRQGEVVEV